MALPDFNYGGEPNEFVFVDKSFWDAFRDSLNPWISEMDKARKQLGVLSEQYRSPIHSAPYRRTIGRPNA